MNTPVNFEIAKLLKEKGFNLKVRYSYGHSINPHIAYPNEDFAISCDFNSPNMGRNWKHLYSAPTIAEVVMWLYKKHGIWVIVSHEISDLHQTEWFWIGVKNGEETASQYFGFNTPTEAYEAAIEYTLKNLI